MQKFGHFFLRPTWANAAANISFIDGTVKNFDMHFEEDSIANTPAKNQSVPWRIKGFLVSSKFDSFFWSRRFPRGPVKHNYPCLFFNILLFNHSKIM